MDIKQKLHWLIQAGISSFCTDAPCVRSSAPTVQPEEAPATAQAAAVACQAADLEGLNRDKADFDLSSLKKTAAHTVLGVGQAEKPCLMCIMETPDADSDKAGQAIAGAAGEQFIKMMQAIHLNGLQDVYLTYLCPWRTPGNRALTDSERALFLPFLIREIELVQPDKILLFGSGVASALLRIDSLAKARGTWHTWHDIPTRVTLAINTLKTTPLRQQAWLDLQEVEKK